jgi:hypothetical protein
MLSEENLLKARLALASALVAVPPRFPNRVLSSMVSSTYGFKSF